MNTFYLNISLVYIGLFLFVFFFTNIYSNYLVPPAPPVPRSTSVQADLPIHTPTPDKPTRQQAQQVMRDLLCKVVLSFTRGKMNNN